MSIDNMCIEKGIAEANREGHGVTNALYQIKGCYDCNGRNEQCPIYFGININLITEPDIKQYLKARAEK